MPKIREIVNEVNNALKAGNFNGRKFQSGIWHGLAYQIEREEKDGDNFITIKRPAIIDNQGEGTDVSYNDTYPITFYHRIISPLQYPSQSKDGYGNAGSVNVEIAELVLICIADRNRVGVFTEDLCAAIIADIPLEINDTVTIALGLMNVDLEVLETNTDPETVFNQEFQGLEFKLSPQMSMISVKYKISSVYGKNCFSLCN